MWNPNAERAVRNLVVAARRELRQAKRQAKAAERRARREAEITSSPESRRIQFDPFTIMARWGRTTQGEV
jgi:hypothetical protein